MEYLYGLLLSIVVIAYVKYSVHGFITHEVIN